MPSWFDSTFLNFFPLLQILVEFDDVDWDTREWLNVYKDNIQLLAVEQSLVLANRVSGPQPSLGHSHPALVSCQTFRSLVVDDVIDKCFKFHKCLLSEVVEKFVKNVAVSTVNTM